MSLTNWFACSQVRQTLYGTECQVPVAALVANFSYQLPTSNCFAPMPAWCYGVTNPNDPLYASCVNVYQPQQWSYNTSVSTWELCAAYQYAFLSNATELSHQCQFDKTMLDQKYNGTYCPFGNDSRGQVESTYVLGIFLLLWAVYAMMFFGNSRR